MISSRTELMVVIKLINKAKDALPTLLTDSDWGVLENVLHGHRKLRPVKVTLRGATPISKPEAETAEAEGNANETAG